METHKRTIAKTISWRIFGTLITSAITWLITHELKFAMTVGVLDTIVKLGSFYLHERSWNRIPYGERR